MSVTVRIVDGPISLREKIDDARGAGAVLDFRGVVRPDEAGKRIVAINYEVYEPMATQQLKELAQNAIENFALASIAVTHSRGRVPVASASLHVAIHSKHRKEGLDAMAWFIDALKRDVPIWKSPVFADDERNDD